MPDYRKSTVLYDSVLFINIKLTNFLYLELWVVFHKSLHVRNALHLLVTFGLELEVIHQLLDSLANLPVVQIQVLKSKTNYQNKLNPNLHPLWGEPWWTDRFDISCKTCSCITVLVSFELNCFEFIWSVFSSFIILLHCGVLYRSSNLVFGK